MAKKKKSSSKKKQKKRKSTKGPAKEARKRKARADYAEEKEKHEKLKKRAKKAKGAERRKLEKKVEEAKERRTVRQEELYRAETKEYGSPTEELPPLDTGGVAHNYPYQIKQLTQNLKQYGIRVATDRSKQAQNIWRYANISYQNKRITKRRLDATEKELRNFQKELEKVRKREQKKLENIRKGKKKKK